MGNILKAIRDDQKRYKRLCRRFGEEPHRGSRGVDPYDGHYDKLKDRALNLSNHNEEDNNG